MPFLKDLVCTKCDRSFPKDELANLSSCCERPLFARQDPESAARTGVFPAPEGAATYVALKHLLRDGLVSREDRVVLFNTGTGLKYIDVMTAEQAGKPARREN